MNTITKSTKFMPLAAATAAGGSTITVDVPLEPGWDSLLFSGTVAVAAANNTLQVKQGDGITWTDVSAAQQAVQADGDTFVLEVFRPLGNLGNQLRLEIVRGTATALGPVLGMLHGPRVRPVTQLATVSVTLLTEPQAVTP